MVPKQTSNYRFFVLNVDVCDTQNSNETKSCTKLSFLFFAVGFLASKERCIRMRRSKLHTDLAYTELHRLDLEKKGIGREVVGEVTNVANVRPSVRSNDCSLIIHI